jgi:hypothetical protein
VSDETRLPDTAYSPEVTDGVYGEMRAIAELLLRAGHVSWQMPCMAGRRKFPKSKLWRGGQMRAFRGFGSMRISMQSRGGCRTGGERRPTPVLQWRGNKGLMDLYKAAPGRGASLDVTHLDAEASATAAARILNLPPHDRGSSVYV